ncbi:MAG: hypothetical protein HYZ85_02080 [Candidatus Omnitrophica bacterium]|nr:hypothetical protein [Candidatus Omnitrophota bacterium]
MPDFDDVLLVKPLPENRFDITVKLPDFLGLLSVITGLFAFNGINIIRGRILTQDKKAVDRFEVEAKQAPDWKNIEADLKKYGERGIQGHFPEIRSEINQRIVQFFRKLKPPKNSRLAPIALQIYQDFSPHETVVDIYAQDTPAFLYELTNALSMLGVNIAKMEIETVGNKVQDRLWVTAADTGEKVTSEEQLKALQWAILLVKQYTHLLADVPDPAQALEQIALFGRDILCRRDFSEVLLSLKRSQNLERLSRLFGTTRFLWEEFIRTQHESVFPILADEKILRFKKNRAPMRRELTLLVRSKKSLEEKITALNEYKDREIFRIDLRHLLGKASYLGEFAEEFTDLAGVVVETAYALAYDETRDGRPAPLISPGQKSECAIFGLGKFGGVELGYASDLELMFVYSDHADSAGEQSRNNLDFYSELVRRLKKIIHARSEGIFEIDLRLRPHGHKGPLAVSLHAFKEYYREGGGAWDFERQALIRLRPVAGPEGLSTQILVLRDDFVFSDQPYDFAKALKLRERQRRELVKAGTFNVKYSEGGLIDLEYLVQTLQIYWGRKNWGDIRNPNTLKALRALWEIGALSEKTFQAIRAAYIFIRTVINALRMVRGNARDLTLPPIESEEFVSLGRRIGYSGVDEDVRKRFLSRLERYKEIAKTLYASYLKDLSEKNWNEPLILEQPRPRAPRVSLNNFLRGDFSVEEKRIMAGLGFRNLQESGMRLARICPHVLAFEPFALALDRAWPIWPQVPDPDLALLHLERFIERLEDKDAFWECLAESKDGLLILLKLLGSSKYLSEILIENPDYGSWLLKLENIRLERTRAVLDHERQKEAAFADGHFLISLRQLRHKETLRIALAEMIGHEPLEEVYATFSGLADFVLESLLRMNKIHEKLCVVGLGKLGGQELNFSSDLDLMFLQGDFGETPELIQGLQILLNQIKEGGPHEFLYRVDLRLRPHGENGALILNEKDTLHYYEKEGDSWELQALIKARAAAGLKSLGKSFLQKISSSIYPLELDSEFLTRVREIKRRYEQITRQKGEEDTRALKEGYELMRRIENRLQLYENRQVFNRPSEKTALRVLAKGLGFSDAGGIAAEEKLEAAYSKTKSQCREIFERVFYSL